VQDRKWSRRDVLKASAVSAAGTLFAEPLVAAAPPAVAVTPDLIEAARKEGKVSFYTALELNTAERVSRMFEARYPGIAVRVERSGAERIFQRIAQEQGSGIKAVDVANSTDPAHYLDWKKSGWLAPYVPEEVAKHFPADQIDPDGMHATSCAWTEAIGYNTNLVKREDAPKGYADLLDPKWQGKIVKGHPGYSGRHLDRDLPARARSGLALSRKARAAEGDAGAVGRRSAEEDPARRARHHGRRQRLQSRAAEGAGQTGRGGLPDRGVAADHRSLRHLPERAQPERGKTVPEFLLQRRDPADTGRQPSPIARFMRWSGRRRGTRRCQR